MGFLVKPMTVVAMSGNNNCLNSRQTLDRLYVFSTKLVWVEHILYSFIRYGAYAVNIHLWFYVNISFTIVW